MYPEIEGVLDQYVRPLLRAHGGDMEVLELTDDGVLRFRLRGRCAGCPAADLTTEDLIRAEVTQRLPQVRQVELVYEVSEELLQQARAILRDHHL
ncbi:NifU family protein [Intestinimonas butyriciproducens]|uniref:NifU family protein n=1 Tax=Intestinimonas butyriciproducens TaxID=1297617 RepID=UPI001959F031|nr:NifU family protein [Intestinimonas butyriciproducens]MBM6975866.1 NifU family protein [Intestinimonas butyriciproducens]